MQQCVNLRKAVYLEELYFLLRIPLVFNVHSHLFTVTISWKLSILRLHFSFTIIIHDCRFVNKLVYFIFSFSLVSELSFIKSATIAASTSCRQAVANWGQCPFFLVTRRHNEGKLTFQDFNMKLMKLRQSSKITFSLDNYIASQLYRKNLWIYNQKDMKKRSSRDVLILLSAAETCVDGTGLTSFHYTKHR